MNIALIIAENTFLRNEKGALVQFETLEGQPLIIYSLETFEKCSLVDVICVSCPVGWEDTIKRLAWKCKITKLKHIYNCSSISYEPIRKIVKSLDEKYPEDSRIVIHDARRALISEDMIRKCIDMLKMHRNVLVGTPCKTPLIDINKEQASQSFFPPTHFWLAETPQCCLLGDLLGACEKAEQLGIGDVSCISEMLQLVGKQPFIITGNAGNMLIDPKNLEVYRRVLQQKEKSKREKKKLVRNEAVSRDFREVWEQLFFDWKRFRGKIFYVSGASGYIGSFIVRSLLWANKKGKLGMKIIAAGRSKDLLKQVYTADIRSAGEKRVLRFHEYSLTEKICYMGHIDYIIHAAAPTSPNYFKSQPKAVWKAIVDGTHNMLKLARRKHVKGMIHLSTMEAMGNGNFFAPRSEDALGVIDAHNPANSCRISKRRAEELCKNFAKKWHVAVSVARLARIISANVTFGSTRIEAELARRVVRKQPLFVPQNGNRVQSCCYITDAVIAILGLLQHGSPAEVYNVANDQFLQSWEDTVEMLAKRYELDIVRSDSSHESAAITTAAEYWGMNPAKIVSLGWKASVTPREAYSRLISSFFYQLYTKRWKKAPSVPRSILSNKKSFIRRVIQWVFSREKPIKNTKIVFSNMHGNGYFCNPKYIAEEIMRRGHCWELVWLVADKETFRKDIPELIRTASWRTDEALNELGDAHVWIDNFNKVPHVRVGLKKRPGQFYINTWHGSLGIKKLDAHVSKFNLPGNSEWLRLAHKHAEMVDLLLTNSSFEDRILPQALWFNCPLKRFGHPRNDIFFFPQNRIDTIRRHVYSSLGIPEDKKIILYAPTFRESKCIDAYLVDVKGILGTLGTDWVFVVRMHRFFQPYSTVIFEFSDQIVDASYYPDIQELMASSDAMITDYSSCIFDFILTRRPGFIYAPDRDSYNEERGMYFPLEETPFPVATSNAELIHNLAHFDYESYQHKTSEFLNRQGCMEDGHAAERVVDLLESIIFPGG